MVQLRDEGRTVMAVKALMAERGFELVYGPRMFPRDTVSVTLPPVRVIPPGGLPPADLRAVSAWIRLNAAAIDAFWEISGVEFGRRLQKLP